MSLINQMLRDLEKRNSAAEQTTPLTQQVHVTAPPPVSKLPALGWNLMAVAAIVGVYFGYQYLGDRPVKSNSVPVQAQTVNQAIAQPVSIQPVSTAPVTPSVSSQTPIASIEQVTQADPAPAITKTEPATPVVLNQSVPAPLDSATSAQSAPAQATAQLTPAQVPVPKPRARNKSTLARPAIQIASSDFEQDFNQENNRPVKLSKSNPRQHAELLYREALNSGEDYLAIPALGRALEFYPQHLNARLLLAKALHRTGQISKTAEFLDDSLAMFPSNRQFINTRAQLYLQQKNPNAALNTLQRVSSDGRSDETYLSLLAAAYQQLNSYSNAGKIYQRLVVINPDKAENWLGLAVAAEKSSDKTMAIEAYQQALSRNTLKPSVVNYIKQRLNDIR